MADTSFGFHEQQWSFRKQVSLYKYSRQLRGKKGLLSEISKFLGFFIRFIAISSKFKKAISPDTFIRVNEEYLKGNEVTLKRIGKYLQKCYFSANFIFFAYSLAVYKYGCVAVVISIPNEMFVYGMTSMNNLIPIMKKSQLKEAVFLCATRATNKT